VTRPRREALIATAIFAAVASVMTVTCALHEPDDPRPTWIPRDDVRFTEQGQ